MGHKELLVEKLGEILKGLPSPKVLDLGSGQSRNILPLLGKFSDLQYVGVEPNASEAKIAEEVLKPYNNARVEHALAYGARNDLGTFDMCISLSVLEHVKQLEQFLKTSVEAVKPGGTIVHWYDLGHALYPHSLKERVHVYLGNTVPSILPETKFVRYVPEQEVCKLLEQYGAKIGRITYHQMPNHKLFLKKFRAETLEAAALAKEIAEWEFKISPYAGALNAKTREHLFPSICVWAVKR